MPFFKVFGMTRPGIEPIGEHYTHWANEPFLEMISLWSIFGKVNGAYISLYMTYLLEKVVKVTNHILQMKRTPSSHKIKC